MQLYQTVCDLVMVDYKERNRKQWETRRRNGTAVSRNKGKFGKIPWNKGLTKETDERVATGGKRVAQSRLGKFRGEKSASWKGGKPSCLDCGKRLSSYKYRYCNVCIHPHMRAENSPHWRGGLTRIGQKLRMTREYKIWRLRVLERDNFKCTWCGSPSNLEVDHIKPFSLFPDLRLEIDNGRTLCKPCHKTTGNYLNKKIKVISNAV